MIYEMILTNIALDYTSLEKTVIYPDSNLLLEIK